MSFGAFFAQRARSRFVVDEAIRSENTRSILHEIESALLTRKLTNSDIVELLTMRIRMHEENIRRM